MAIYIYIYDTNNTQDKVICNENGNYAMIQNKEEELENTKDIQQEI